jgi:hypothetical protein
MSETKWTPGPWEPQRAAYLSDGGRDFGIRADVAGENVVVAETFERVGERIRAPASANAYLIAAAPELYEALEQITIRWMDPGSITVEHWQAARDALAKARG